MACVDDPLRQEYLVKKIVRELGWFNNESVWKRTRAEHFVQYWFINQENLICL